MSALALHSWLSNLSGTKTVRQTSNRYVAAASALTSLLLTPRAEENTHTVTFETGKFCDQIGADRKRVVPLMVGRDVLTRGGCFSFRKVEENLSTFACTFESCDPEGLAADLAKRLSRRALDSSLADLSGIGFGSIFGGGGARSARKRAEQQLSKGELKEMGNTSESGLKDVRGRWTTTETDIYPSARKERVQEGH